MKKSLEKQNLSSFCNALWVHILLPRDRLKPFWTARPGEVQFRILHVVGQLSSRFNSGWLHNVGLFLQEFCAQVGLPWPKLVAILTLQTLKGYRLLSALCSVFIRLDLGE